MAQEAQQSPGSRRKRRVVQFALALTIAAAAFGAY